MNTVSRAHLLPTKFWMIAFVILACALYILFVSKLFVSEQQPGNELVSPTGVEQSPAQRSLQVEHQ